MNINELLTPEFMAKHTTFASLTAMFEEMGYKVTNQQELDSVPPGKIDEFVKQNTRYLSWAEMKSAAERASLSV